MKFTKLQIKKFRHIENQTIELWNTLTAIAWQNGTWKSSILWWIAQSCDFKAKTKTPLNTSFKSQYSEVFRFCPEQDYTQVYDVSIYYKTNDVSNTNLTNNASEVEKIKKITTRFSETEKRYRVDFDWRGIAIDYPIIYLWLKRLTPLATEKNIQIQNLELSNSEKEQFSKLSQEILFLTRDKIDAEHIKSTSKQILAMKTSNYGHLGNSAWQDNLWQIISSILSFGKIQNEPNYDWWILLIDEIDASLYAWSQIKLIEKLFTLAKKLNIQVIFTTHSIEILEYLSKKTWPDIKINFLKSKNNRVINEINPNIDLLKNIIKVQTGELKTIEKVEFICEDNVTELWCKNLINWNEIKSRVNFSKWPFPHWTLDTMANSKHTIFKHVKFVLDGDCKKEYNNKKKNNKIILLPWNHKPEKVLFDFIKSLDDEDEFWDEDNNFTHQTCFGNFIQNQQHKKWFEDEENKRLFGKWYSKLFNRRKKSHKKESEDFIESIKRIIN